MTIEVKVPDIGTDEVEITETLVKVGDRVKAEQSPITVEGDKASMEVPSPQAGTVKEIRVSIGDKTQTGALIMIFDSADGAADIAPAQAEERKEAAPAVAPAATAVRDVNVPDIDSDGVGVTETLVKIGDKVEAEQSLIAIEGDKASMEVPALFAGTVKEIKVSVDDKASTGLLIMVFEVADEADTTTPTAKQGAAPAAAPAPAIGVKEVSVPDIGGDEIKTIGVMVKVGNKIAVEQPLIIVEGGKASMEVLVPFVGVVKELKVNVDDKVRTGSLIMILEVEGAMLAVAPVKQRTAAPVPAAKAETPAAAPATKAEGRSEFAENDAYIHATPLTRRLTREFGVNPTKMEDTGRKGCILHEDVQVYVREAIKRAEAAPAVTGGGTPGMLPWLKVGFSKFGEIEEVKLSHIQKTSGVNLSRNWVVIPHATRFDKTDITELETFRKQQNEEATKRKLDAKITPVVFIMKVIATILEQVPHFNSSLSEDGQRPALKKHINIGVAVDTPNGLAVPIFKDVNKKSIIELSRELMTTSKKTRDGKLTAGEIQGSYFTTSSIGGPGTTHFAPIMSASEVVILGVSKSAMESMRNGKEFVPRLMLSTSLSFDHCAVDGADGARFITIINNALPDIRHLVMQVKEPAQRPAFFWQSHKYIEAISE